MVGLFSPKNTVKQLLSMVPWSSTPLHSWSNPCFQEAPRQLWETKAVGRETLEQISKWWAGGRSHTARRSWRGRAEHPPEPGTALDLT